MWLTRVISFSVIGLGHVESGSHFEFYVQIDFVLIVP